MFNVDAYLLLSVHDQRSRQLRQQATRRALVRQALGRTVGDPGGRAGERAWRSPLHRRRVAAGP